MAATKASARPAPGNRKIVVLLLLLGMPVALLLLPTTLVLIPAMIPTIVARIVDPGPGRHLTITVGSLNLAGSLWFIHDLWAFGQDYSEILPTLGDMLGWLSALLGAGLGWVIYWMMPGFTRTIVSARSSLRLARIRKSQEELIDLWGTAVRDPLTPR